MTMNGLILRRETPPDYKTVENVTREAFWNHHGPGCEEHYLMHIMRDADAFIPELDFVAEIDGEIVGNIVYTKSKIVGDDDVEHEVLTFGPVSVLPAYQGKGIGSELIEHTKWLAKEMGYKAILIYGDPAYYKRFGFVQAEQYDIRTADNYYAVPLLASVLEPGALSKIQGRFFEDDAFHFDEEAVKEFDQEFPEKALEEGLPSQILFKELVKMRRPKA